LYFSLFSIVLRIVVSLLPYCCCARGVSIAFARPYIADGVDYPLQIDCIFIRRVRTGRGAIVLFFPLFPPVLVSAAFSCPPKALHWNWRRIFPVNRLYFVLTAPWGSDGLRALCASSGLLAAKSAVPTGISARLEPELGLFCADSKTVESIAILKLQMVLWAGLFPSTEHPSGCRENETNDWSGAVSKTNPENRAVSTNAHLGIP
jgi:hypothetical protein